MLGIEESISRPEGAPWRRERCQNSNAELGGTVIVISLIIQYRSLNILGKVTHKVGKISIRRIRIVRKFKNHARPPRK